MSLATKIDTAKRRAGSFVHLGLGGGRTYLGFCLARLGVKPSASYIGKHFTPGLHPRTSNSYCEMEFH